MKCITKYALKSISKNIITQSDIMCEKHGNTK